MFSHPHKNSELFCHFPCSPKRGLHLAFLWNLTFTTNNCWLLMACHSTRVTTRQWKNSYAFYRLCLQVCSSKAWQCCNKCEFVNGMVILQFYYRATKCERQVPINTGMYEGGQQIFIELICFYSNYVYYNDDEIPISLGFRGKTCNESLIFLFLENLGSCVY